MIKAKNVDSYIKQFPPEIQKSLKKLRATVKKAAPGAEEIISYGMPAYKYHGMLVYFSVHTNHIGLYPMPSAIVKFKKEASLYVPPKTKSTLRFPFDKKLPLSLITKIIKWRVKENLTKKKK